MERRYLAATLALAATFAIFSGEFYTRSLSKVPRTPAEVKADIACAKHYVVQQLVAKLESYLGRSSSDHGPVLAQLNLPELPEIPAAALAPAAPTVSQCPLQRLHRKSAEPEINIRVFTDKEIQSLADLSTVRAELLSERAQEWQNQMNARQMEISVKAMEHAQQMSAHAMARAQREMQKSRTRMTVPSSAIHINFVAPAPAVAPLPPTPASF